MKNLFRVVVLLAVAGNACAVEPPPVLLVVLTDMGAKNQADGSAGLLVFAIGAWANHSVNKQSARKVESYMRVLGMPDFLSQSQAAFACFANSQPCAARPAFADVNLFSEALRAGPVQEGYIVELLPELVAEQLMIRSTAYLVRLPADGSGTPTKVSHNYHALYTVRAPPTLATKKTNPAALEAYWSDGDPRRIANATSRGLAEINALFAMLIRQEGGGPGEATMNLNQFPDKKRLACKSEVFCGMTYLLKDNGDSFVLVYNGNYAGWFDAEAAAFGAYLPTMAQFGPSGKMLPGPH
jgi:hypothetical protein